MTLLFNEKYCKQAVMKGEMSHINGKYYFLGKEINTTAMLPDHINCINIDDIDDSYINKMLNIEEEYVNRNENCLYKKTKIHLEFIYNRLINKYNENKNYDYMIKFKEIIDDMDN